MGRWAFSVEWVDCASRFLAFNSGVWFLNIERKSEGERDEKSVLCQEKLREVSNEAITSHCTLYLFVFQKSFSHCPRPTSKLLGRTGAYVFNVWLDFLHG